MKAVAEVRGRMALMHGRERNQENQSAKPSSRTICIEPALTDGTLLTRLRVSRNLRSYFRSFEFELRYEEEIRADDGLLSVPGIAMMLPLAWITGADLHVGCVDRTFLEAAGALQIEYRKIYPLAPFGTRVIADEIVESAPNPNGLALLYSGGLDATFSFFANRERRPRLIQMLGTDISVSNTEYMRLAEKETAVFAAKHGVEVSFVRTNALEVFDPGMVMHRFWRCRERVNGDLWKGMGYALGHLAMTAPLSAGRFDHLMIAAWADRQRANKMRENPDASSPRVDRHIAWSNLRVEHHGCLHRYEKAVAMKDWVPGNLLRVCWFPQSEPGSRRGLNCCRCEKCVRSITALAIAGVDPERCGFTIDQGTLEYMRGVLETRQMKPSHFALWWEPMQRAIPANIEHEMNGLRDFLEWFRAFDFGNGEDPKPHPWSLGELYYRFPYRVAKLVRAIVYGIIGEPSKR